MARLPVHSVETKLRIVLGVLRGELSAAEAARRHGISETSIGKWKDPSLGAGKTGLAAAKGPRRGPSAREAQLAAQVDDLARALGEAHVELRFAPRRGGAPSYSELEVMRRQAGLSVARLCRLAGIHRSTWYRWAARARDGGPQRGPWPRPVSDRIDGSARDMALAHRSRGRIGSRRSGW